MKIATSDALATRDKRQATSLLLLVACCLLLFTATTVFAENATPRISARLDRSTITVGDRLHLVLEVDAPEGSRVLFPSFKEKLGDLDVKAVHPKDRTLEVVLTSYAVGSFAIPILTTKVVLPDGKELSLETLQLFIEVASVIKEGDPISDIHDIKGVIALPGFFLSPWLFGWIGLLAGLAGLAGWFILRRKKITPPLPSPPQITALEALDRLDATLLWERDVKEYHFQVSQILRVYLEERFGVRAPQKTTEEFLESASKDQLLIDSQKALLQSFLEQCDLVKFAKLTPAGQEARRVAQLARGFIHQTMPVSD